MQDKVFFAINPDGEIKLQNIFDHIASDRARMKYRQPRRSSGQWTTMIEVFYTQIIIPQPFLAPGRHRQDHQFRQICIWSQR